MAPFSPVSPSSAELMKTRGPEKRGVLARAIQGRIYMILEAERLGLQFPLGIRTAKLETTVAEKRLCTPDLLPDPHHLPRVGGQVQLPHSPAAMTPSLPSH